MLLQKCVNITRLISKIDHFISRSCIINNSYYLRFLSTKMTSTARENLFTGVSDRYNGVTIDSKNEICKSEEFTTKLSESLSYWTAIAKRCIWFKVRTEQADWIPILTKNGFNFHHAKNGFVMMFKWLPKEETCNVPNFANTNVGVGAVVVNDKEEILVVTEKYYEVPHWKLPGGYVEPGENLVDAAIREVIEETSIKTEFLSLLTVRHGHFGMFDCSDLYFVLALRPLTSDISMCDREITRCEWMSLSKYLSHPNVHELNRFFVEKYLEYQKNKVKIDCKHGIHAIVQKPYTVYHAVKYDS